MNKRPVFPVMALLALTASARLAAEDAVLPKDLVLPANVSAAIYLPKHLREFRSAYRSAGGFQTTDSVQLGSTFEDSTLAAAQHFFRSGFMYEVTGGTPPYGLLIAVHPTVKAEDKQLVATARYQVYDAAGNSVLKGDSVVRWAPGFGTHTADVLGNLLEQVITRVLTDVVVLLRPTAEKYPTRQATQPGAALLVDKDHPVTSGTGFFLNSSGQVLTAAHVAHECAVLEVRHAGNSVPAAVTTSTALLDLAVLDTKVNDARTLPLRQGGHAVLGESVVNIGFPLQSLMTDAPTVTRGTLSSRAGLNGSLGQFQFSAPIQPGASGGPVIGARGDVVGVAVGTLNAAELLKMGILPQNVNFALEADYVEKYLRSKSIVFAEGPADGHSQGDAPLDDTLPAVVGIKCYQ
ncbi:MAG: trypsin-like peptidase domain-containing protein [Proteobacteria bacterium]|nr:trypsin-like peptidase domain-containing protein [Pseudomonadota bacterium]